MSCIKIEVEGKLMLILIVRVHKHYITNQHDKYANGSDDDKVKTCHPCIYFS